MEQTQPVYRESKPKREMNPSFKSYVYWHILNHIKAQIQEVMDQMEAESEGDNSITEKRLYTLIQPIFVELDTFFSNIKNIVESQNNKDE